MAKKKPYVIIRTYSAGVHAGFLESKKSTIAGVEVRLSNARRLWYWSGAASLSQLSVDGVSRPNDCKFPTEVPWIDLIAIEVLPCSKKAQESIKSVPVWKA
jgi:hypothetical protein